MTNVYLSGKYVGKVEDPESFVTNLREERRKGRISQEINLQHDRTLQSVFVETSKGRLRRPLIIVKDGKPLLTEEHLEKLKKKELSWSDMIKQGIIEYLDASEEENALTAFYESELTPEHTHLEIAPLSMFGITTSLVPFTNYNSAQKVNTGSKNQKQALGFYAANYHVRIDMDVNLLHYPQKPMVRSVMHDVFEYEKHPSGQNVTIAVMSYKGYNMDDAIVINQGSIERGLGRSSYYRPIISEELRYPED